MPIGIPLAGKGHAGRILRHLEVERALDPGLVAEADGRRGEVGRGARQRDEELPAVDHVAAVHLARGRAEAAAAHAERGIRLPLLHRLAVGLSVEHALLDHLAELRGAELLVALARAGGIGMASAITPIISMVRQCMLKVSAVEALPCAICSATRQ